MLKTIVNLRCNLSSKMIFSLDHVTSLQRFNAHNNIEELLIALHLRHLLLSFCVAESNKVSCFFLCFYDIIIFPIANPEWIQDNPEI